MQEKLEACQSPSLWNLLAGKRALQKSSPHVPNLIFSLLLLSLLHILCTLPLILLFPFIVHMWCNFYQFPLI